MGYEIEKNVNGKVYLTSIFFEILKYLKREGEILLRGVALFHGYYRDPWQSRAALFNYIIFHFFF
jgi:long-subunit acyl-CoA synthetase (AMP-forming)